MALTLRAYSNELETAGLELTGGAPTETYAVLVQGRRANGFVFTNGAGEVVTDRDGNATWDEFGASDGTGQPYTAAFYVADQVAEVEVQQYPVQE